MSIFNSLIPTLNGPRAQGAAPYRLPRHELREVNGDYHVTVYLPGVAKDAIEVTDESGRLTVVGQVKSTLPEGVTALLRETTDAAFRLVVTHDESIDADKIGAEFKDGVLQLKLLQAESAKPRKVAVS